MLSLAYVLLGNMHHSYVLFNLLPHLVSDHRLCGQECACLGHCVSPAVESRASHSQLQVRDMDSKVTFSDQRLLSNGFCPSP